MQIFRDLQSNVILKISFSNEYQNISFIFMLNINKIMPMTCFESVTHEKRTSEIKYNDNNG